nr:hypothetical protein [Tanacetum cinerariifolium]
MLMPHQVADDVADDAAEPSPPLPTPAITPPPQQVVISTLPPSPHQSPIAQPSSPPPQQPPSYDAAISMDLLSPLLETCTTLTRKVKALEHDKIAQALEITKLKQRVRRLEKRGRGCIQTGGIIVELDTDEDVTLEEVDAEKDAEVAKKDDDAQGRQEESQAQVYHIDLEHVDKVLSIQDDETEPVKLKEVIEVVTTAKLMTEVVTAVATITAAPSAVRRRKGVVIKDHKEIANPSIIVHSESFRVVEIEEDWRKVILVEEPKPLKKQELIKQDEAYARELEAEPNANINYDEVIEHAKRKEKQDNAVLRYQPLKRKPQTKAHARKNMMVYLKNMVGFKMDFFKEKSEKELEEEASKALKRKKKSKKELEEEASKALKRKSKSLEQPKSRSLMKNFGVDVVEDFKEYTLRDYYCWLKTYCCWYKIKLLDNAADSRLRLLEESVVVDDKMKK